jgi:predicted ABC-type transport system involved in lysophospholipase L1 biosynthesis ATPase subunit
MEARDGLLERSASSRARPTARGSYRAAAAARRLARALVLSPKLLLADEPTGNLDTVTADEVFALLREFNHDHGSACLIVTHDPRLAARCDRQIVLVDGQLTTPT